MTPKIRKTRPQLVQFLRELGYPYGKSTLDKLCAPAVDRGPPVDAWIGARLSSERSRTRSRTPAEAADKGAAA
jgi:hypothetical protein